MNKPIDNELSDTELDVVSGGACRGGDADDTYQRGRDRDGDRDRNRNRGGHHHHRRNNGGGNDHDHDHDDMHRPY